MLFQTRLQTLVILLLVGICSIYSQDKQELKLQINSHDTLITFQWATISGKTFLVMGKSGQGESSAEVNLAGMVEDSIGKALRSMGFNSKIASFIDSTIKIDSSCTYSSFAIQLKIGTYEYTTSFELSRKKKSDPFTVVFNGKNDTVANGKLESALVKTGLPDVIEKKVSKELSLSINSVVIELSKRIQSLETILQLNKPIGEIKLRTTKVKPSRSYDGYWTISGPFKKVDGSCFIKTIRGLWSYAIPYFGPSLGQVDEMWQVKLEPDTNKTHDSLDIKEVEIAVKNGSFKQIVVRTQGKNGLIDFYNDAPISIATWNTIYNYNYERRYESILFAKNIKGETLTFLASDLLYYSVHPQREGNFIPIDTMIILKPGKETSGITLMRQNFMNNFDLRVYSDISGLKRESANGLLQLDLRYKFILNNSETETFYDGYQAFIYPAFLSMLYEVSQYNRFPFVTAPIIVGSILLFSSQIPTCFATKIEPFVIVPRLEDRANLLLNARDTVSASVNRFDLYRFANLKFGIDFEYLRVRLDQLNLFASIGASAGIIRTSLDSIVLRSEKIAGNQYLHSYFIMPYIQFEPISSENIKFVTRYSFLASKLMDTKVNNIDIAEINNIKITDGLSGSFIHIVQADFNVYPTEDKSSWLFFRAIYYASDPSSDLSLQFGYSTSLNNILNLGK